MTLKDKLTDEVLVNAVNAFNMYDRPSAQGREAMRTVLLVALEGQETTGGPPPAPPDEDDPGIQGPRRKP